MENNGKIEWDGRTHVANQEKKEKIQIENKKVNNKHNPKIMLSKKMQGWLVLKMITNT
jgi:hypothetical protein